jgi:hypothetical protein
MMRMKRQIDDRRDILICVHCRTCAAHQELCLDRFLPCVKYNHVANYSGSKVSSKVGKVIGGDGSAASS